jgi:predicted AlkP superfamily pyrophosphatase or phosphodiesterase
MYGSQPHFMFIDLIDGHEKTQKSVRILDVQLPELIQELMSDGRTVLLLTSDHGIADRGQSPTVRLEERLPLSMLITPSEFTTGKWKWNIYFHAKVVSS